MFEVGWGELVVLTGVGFLVVGKKDLPRAAGIVGNRVGRIVGLLQGARARVDTYAQQSELKMLHTELKSGLRELDAVKSEMAVAMSSRGMTGPGNQTIQRTVLTPPQPPPPVEHVINPPQLTTISGDGGISASKSSSPLTSSSPNISGLASSAQVLAPLPGSSSRELPPESQTIAAVAEDQWVQQGISFRSRAERGVGLGYSEEDANNPLNSGSSILANIYQQNLIFDQYDRVVQEQDNVLQSKIDDIQAKRQQEKGKKQD